MRSYEGRYTFWEGYRNACAFLTDGQELAFRRAIDGYAFDGEAPDFEDDQMLSMAWELIIANLDKGIRQSRGGRKGKEQQLKNNPGGYPKNRPNLGTQTGLGEQPKQGYANNPNWGLPTTQIAKDKDKDKGQFKDKGEGGPGEGAPTCIRCGQPLYQKTDGSWICFSCREVVA